jgi:hypothetical protein
MSKETYGQDIPGGVYIEPDDAPSEKPREGATPRTDALDRKAAETPDDVAEVDYRILARKLERENAELHIVNCEAFDHIKGLERELAEAKERESGLSDALLDTEAVHAAAISRERLANMRADQAEEARDAAQLVISLTRTILAGNDAGSLPNDFPVYGMAAERMKDLLNARRELEAAQSATERNASNYRWMIENPYDVLLAFSEATNQDTYGLIRDAEIPVQKMREYLITRLDELMAMAAAESCNNVKEKQ